MKKILYSGTFDPPTLGHLDIIQRAAALCDQLVIGIGFNSAKDNALFSLDERISMLKCITSSISNTEVIGFEGLAINFAKERDISFIVRGLRGEADLPNEISMALMNRKMSGIETLFLISDPNYAYINASLVREVGMSGHHLRDFVPASIESAVSNKLKALKNRHR